MDKDVDVVAFAMIGLQHQRGAAAETPVQHGADGLLEMVENFHREVEQNEPLA